MVYIKFSGHFCDSLTMEKQVVWHTYYIKNILRWHGLIDEFKRLEIGHLQFNRREMISSQIFSYRKSMGIAVGGMP